MPMMWLGEVNHCKTSGWGMSGSGIWQHFSLPRDPPFSDVQWNDQGAWPWPWCDEIRLDIRLDDTGFDDLGLKHDLKWEEPFVLFQRNSKRSFDNDAGWLILRASSTELPVMICWIWKLFCFLLMFMRASLRTLPWMSSISFVSGKTWRSDFNFFWPLCEDLAHTTGRPIASLEELTPSSRQPKSGVQGSARGSLKLSSQRAACPVPAAQDHHLLTAGQHKHLAGSSSCSSWAPPQMTPCCSHIDSQFLRVNPHCIILGTLIVSSTHTMRWIIEFQQHTMIIVGHSHIVIMLNPWTPDLSLIFWYLNPMKSHWVQTNHQ